MASTRSTNILSSFYASTANDLLSLYRPGIVVPSDRIFPSHYSGKITSLKARIAIQSITESTIPSSAATTTRSERIETLQRLEWSGPRKQLDLFLSSAYEPRQLLTSVALLNRSPFYTVDLLKLLGDGRDFLVAPDTELSAQIAPTDYGLLQGEDVCTIWGTVEEFAPTAAIRGEITTLEEYDWSVGTSSLVILPPNAKRLQVELANQSSSETIWLSYGPTAEVNRGISLPPGSRYQITLNNLYRGAISAISTGTALLVGIEAS